MPTRWLTRVANPSPATCFLLLAAFFLPNLHVAADDRVDYLTQIKPVLRQRCYACHGALKQEAGLRLDTAGLAIQGGDSGAVIERGSPDTSLLLARVSAADEAERMPPEGEPLTPEQIALLRNWISQNATAPADESPEQEAHEHWAFRAPVRPPVPRFESPTSSSNPIDAFLAREQRQHGLTPQPAADKRIWLRRVSLDLVGLPPALEQQEAFLADQSEQAYDTVITRLLASPQYGERWGRHWMDIWRYSDWWGLGAEVRNSQKHMWHWRDWIVESLNADQGYDQMLREMLAADELYPNDLDRLRATGYLARQYFIFNRTAWLDETIEHTAKGMLGLTFNCAKCHDHKYDPLLQTDYYQLRAVFEPYQIRTELVPGEIDFEKDGIPRAFDAHLDIPTYLHIRGDDRNPDKSRALSPAVPAFLTTPELQLVIEPVALPVEATYPGLRDHVVEAHRQAAEEQIAAARTALEAAREKLGEPQAAAETLAATVGGPAEQPPAAARLPVEQASVAVTIAEKSVQSAEAQLASVDARAAADRARHRGCAATGSTSASADELALAAAKSERILAAARAAEDLSRAELALLQAAADKKAEAESKVAAAKTALDEANKAIDVPSSAYTPLPGAKKTQEDYQNRNADTPMLTTSSGRRSAFAKWITNPRNPLTARVAVNHIWARHMGKPLVPTVFDFGRKGMAPTHPELLDWLAVELVEHNWSMKHIHRLIVSSQAYRRQSTTAGAAESNLAADPDNGYYWRMNSLRMEAEVVRDSLLQLGGELDLSMGGPSIPINDESSRRRSLYYVHSHNDHQKFLSMFDNANVLECYRRAESIVPQQALALENSPLVAEMAEKIDAQIAGAQANVDSSSNCSDAAFIRTAFLLVLSAEPSAAELNFIGEMLPGLTEAARANHRPNPESHARRAVIQALLNHNDFVTIR